MCLIIWQILFFISEDKRDAKYRNTAEIQTNILTRELEDITGMRLGINLSH